MTGQITQEYVEVLDVTPGSGRLTQDYVEVLQVAPGAGRVTQCYVEVLRSTADLLTGQAGAPVIVVATG